MLVYKAKTYGGKPMDEFVAKFLQELSANLFFVKNFFFFFEHQIVMIFQGKSGTNPFWVITFFAFWNKSLGYLVSLFNRNEENYNSFSKFFAYVSDNKDRLIPEERREYFKKFEERYRSYLAQKASALDTIQKTGSLYHKTTSLTKENAILVKDAVFDTVVFTNEMYVNICNLFEVNIAKPQYIS